MNKFLSLFEFVNNWDKPFQIIAFIVGLGIGVFFLVKFCDIFVDSACSIAKKAKISPLIIGLTIVAMGTSCPELAVSVSDSISTLVEGGHANVAIGNVVGSNICNILIVLGFSAVFTPIIVKKSIIKRENPMLLLITIVMVIFGCFFGLSGFITDYAITRWEGIILVIMMIAYIWLMIANAKKHPEDAEIEGDIKEMSLWKSIILVILGAAGIIIGGELVVFGAKGLAVDFAVAAGLNHDMAESLVGLTIVAVGTSLPELVTSVVAAKKGQNEMALGNVIGSNIFNGLFVMGISATVNPLTTGSQIIIDLIVMLAATVLLVLISKKGKITKGNGFLFIGCYVAYVAYLIIRTLVSGI